MWASMGKHAFVRSTWIMRNETKPFFSTSAASNMTTVVVTNATAMLITRYMRVLCAGLFSSKIHHSLSELRLRTAMEPLSCGRSVPLEEVLSIWSVSLMTLSENTSRSTMKPLPRTIWKNAWILMVAGRIQTKRCCLYAPKMGWTGYVHWNWAQFRGSEWVEQC